MLNTAYTSQYVLSVFLVVRSIRTIGLGSGLRSARVRARVVGGGMGGAREAKHVIHKMLPKVLQKCWPSRRGGMDAYRAAKENVALSHIVASRTQTCAVVSHVFTSVTTKCAAVSHILTSGNAQCHVVSHIFISGTAKCVVVSDLLEMGLQNGLLRHTCWVRFKHFP